MSIRTGEREGGGRFYSRTGSYLRVGSYSLYSLSGVVDVGRRLDGVEHGVLPVFLFYKQQHSVTLTVKRQYNRNIVLGLKNTA